MFYSIIVSVRIVALAALLSTVLPLCICPSGAVPNTAKAERKVNEALGENYHVSKEGLRKITEFEKDQTSTNTDAQQEYAKADAKLNQVYKRILHDYAQDKLFLDKLKAAQRAWITFRDAQLEARFPAPDKRYEYGSIYPLCAAEELTELTKQRIKQLQVWLTPWPADNCRGSIH